MSKLTSRVKRHLNFFFVHTSLLGNVLKSRVKVAPIGATPGGGKILKVRWGLPGRGKSGSLRLAVVAYCDERRVVVADAFFRKTDPSDDDFFSAVQSLP